MEIPGRFVMFHSVDNRSNILVQGLACPDLGSSMRYMFDYAIFGDAIFGEVHSVVTT
jgi:hypothetical protein